jgi:uncharacterized protein
LSRGRLAVFAKAPQPGRVKTRLCPPLTFEQAASLYAAMLDDVLEASAGFARTLGLEAWLHFEPAPARAELAARAPSTYQLEPQLGPELASRMANAFARAAEAGCERMLLRGSDSPGLDFETVVEALEHLDAGADLVLTPDQGGGYALIGLKKPRTPLFEVAMSTMSVLDETLARARALGLSTALTRTSFDIDRAADLARVEALPAERSSVLCPRTVESIRALRASVL